MAESHMYVGIDVGGTSTRISVFQSLASPDIRPLVKFDTFQSYEEQLSAIINTVQGSGLKSFSGIGVSFGGRITKDGRSVADAPNLPEYVGKPFVQDLSNQFGCAVRLAHDPVCGLLAEKKFGYMGNFDRCAYLTVSTGTGAAIQLRKASSMLLLSIEMGHQILDGNPLQCLCGQVGCLETFTGGKQLELRYGQSVTQIVARDTTFWDMFTDKLALGLVNLAQLTRVEVVVMGGSIILNNTFLLALLQHKVNTMIRRTTLELSLASLGENAPLVGAALLHEIPEDAILH